MEPNELSAQSHDILAAIAEGHSFGQILAGNPTLTYEDIACAAAEVLNVADHAYAHKASERQSAVPRTAKTYDQRMAEIRQAHPRAYAPWSDDEDARLTQLFRSGTSARELAAALQRQPNAIRCCLVKLNLTQAPHPNAMP